MTDYRYGGLLPSLCTIMRPNVTRQLPNLDNRKNYKSKLLHENVEMHVQ